MTVDALIARMTQDAQARIAQLRADADAEVVALEQARAAASSRDAEQALEARRAERQLAFAVEHTQARRHAAAAVLRAQHALLDRVFARAEVLGAQTGAEAPVLDALPRLVAAVLPYLGGRPALLRCRPDLVAPLQTLLAGAGQVDIVADTTLPAGLIVDARDQSCSIDGTLPALLAALRPRLEATLLARMPT